LHTEIHTNMDVISSLPIQLAQYTPSSEGVTLDDGDPSMIIVPSLDNLDSVYTITTPSEIYYRDFISIAIKAGKQTGVHINGVQINATWNNVIGQLEMVCIMSLASSKWYV